MSDAPPTPAGPDRPPRWVRPATYTWLGFLAAYVLVLVTGAAWPGGLLGPGVIGALFGLSLLNLAFLTVLLRASLAHARRR